MKTSIDRIKYYGCAYPSSITPASKWWFCTTDETLISEEELLQKFGYNDTDEILATGIFIPFFRSDIVKLEKEFLEKLHLHSVIDSLNAQEDFDVGFRCYVDSNSLFNDWHDYLGQRLESDAKKWCHENGVRFS